MNVSFTNLSEGAWKSMNENIMAVQNAVKFVTLQFVKKLAIQMIDGLDKHEFIKVLDSCKNDFDGQYFEIFQKFMRPSDARDAAGAFSYQTYSFFQRNHIRIVDRIVDICLDSAEILDVEFTDFDGFTLHAFDLEGNIRKLISHSDVKAVFANDFNKQTIDEIIKKLTTRYYRLICLSLVQTIHPFAHATVIQRFTNLIAPKKDGK